MLDTTYTTTFLLFLTPMGLSLTTELVLLPVAPTDQLGSCYMLITLRLRD